MSNKETYKALCEAAGDDIPLFLQYWWLDAACGDKTWDVLLTRKGDAVTAAMPCLLRKKLGMRYVLQPQLTPYCGPVFFYPQGMRAERKARFEHAAAKALADQLKEMRLDYFQQNFAPSVTDWLPFFWAGYRQTTRYTYVIPDIGDPDKAFAAFDPDMRQKKILRLLPRVSLTEGTTPEQLAAWHEHYWRSKGQRDVLPQRLMARVAHAAIARGNGAILTLSDDDGTPLVSRFVAYDSRCAHSMFSAQNPNRRVPNAADALVWLTLLRMSGLTRAYDFEGGMQQSIEHYYRSFGATQVPYHALEKCNNPLFRLALKLKGRQRPAPRGETP
ncbi:MAG: GNAT family N-acetyltransferase [Bacteroidales bacterium]|nr:GNAT family N-acetyltransferase [Bacteroidales bacterium]